MLSVREIKNEQLGERKDSIICSTSYESRLELEKMDGDNIWNTLIISLQES